MRDDDAGMDGGAAGHHLADCQCVVGLLAAEFLQHLPGHRHVSRAAHEQDAIDGVPAQAGAAEDGFITRQHAHQLRQQHQARGDVQSYQDLQKGHGRQRSPALPLIDTR